MPATLEISLPEPLNEFVHEQVKSGRYRDASAYIASLVGAASKAKNAPTTPPSQAAAEDIEPFIPDTSVAMTVEQMAEAFHRLGTPTQQADAELTFDPDEDPPY
jgi:Arc/MetJ-type ribon-helix-helix transcriptional regulator